MLFLAHHHQESKVHINACAAAHSPTILKCMWLVLCHWVIPCAVCSTGLRTYPTYAMGGGYVLSGDVAKMLVTIHLNMKLKFTPIEDATVGFWLMSMDLRHIDHRRFHTWAAACCFKPPQRREGQRAATRCVHLHIWLNGRQNTTGKT